MSWVRTEYDGGKVRKTATVTVTDLRINPSLAPGDFEITFPPGTHVHDQRNRKEYRVQPSGGLRELDVYGKETGGDIPQPGTSWVSRNKWLVVGLVFTVTCAVLLLWRRARLQKGGQSGEKDSA